MWCRTIATTGILTLASVPLAPAAVPGRTPALELREAISPSSMQSLEEQKGLEAGREADARRQLHAQGIDIGNKALEEVREMDTQPRSAPDAERAPDPAGAVSPSRIRGLKEQPAEESPAGAVTPSSIRRLEEQKAAENPAGAVTPSSRPRPSGQGRAGAVSPSRVRGLKEQPAEESPAGAVTPSSIRRLEEQKAAENPAGAVTPSSRPRPSGQGRAGAVSPSRVRGLKELKELEEQPAEDNPAGAVTPSRRPTGGGFAPSSSGPQGLDGAGATRARTPEGGLTAARAGCRIKGNINREGERIYHRPGGPWYSRVRIRPGDGERWFCNAAEAQRAGFRAARR